MYFFYYYLDASFGSNYSLANMSPLAILVTVIFLNFRLWVDSPFHVHP